jgi:hypothetical protein
MLSVCRLNELQEVVEVAAQLPKRKWANPFVPD